MFHDMADTFHYIPLRRILSTRLFQSWLVCWFHFPSYELSHPPYTLPIHLHTYVRYSTSNLLHSQNKLKHSHPSFFPFETGLDRDRAVFQVKVVCCLCDLSPGKDCWSDDLTDRFSWEVGSRGRILGAEDEGKLLIFALSIRI